MKKKNPKLLLIIDIIVVQKKKKKSRTLIFKVSLFRNPRDFNKWEKETTQFCIVSVIFPTFSRQPNRKHSQQKRKIKNWEVRKKKKHTRSGGEFSETQDGDPTTWYYNSPGFYR